MGHAYWLSVQFSSHLKFKDTSSRSRIETHTNIEKVRRLATQWRCRSQNIYFFILYSFFKPKTRQKREMRVKTSFAEMKRKKSYQDGIQSHSWPLARILFIFPTNFSIDIEFMLGSSKLLQTCIWLKYIEWKTQKRKQSPKISNKSSFCCWSSTGLSFKILKYLNFMHF